MEWSSSGFEVSAIIGRASYQPYDDVPNVVAQWRHASASRPF
jgi:hypothetical protein